VHVKQCGCCLLDERSEFCYFLWIRQVGLLFPVCGEGSVQWHNEGSNNGFLGLQYKPGVQFEDIWVIQFSRRRVSGFYNEKEEAITNWRMFFS